MVRIALALVLATVAASAPAVASPAVTLRAASPLQVAAAQALAPIARAAGPKGRTHRMDVAVTKLEVDPQRAPLVVTAEVQVAISDPRGKILCVVAGAAKLQVEGRTVQPHQLPQLRADAVVAAVEGMSDKLRARLAAGN